MIKSHKKVLNSLLIFITLAVVSVWVIGWTSIEYNQSSEEIGKKIVIATPVVNVKNKPGKYRGGLFSQKYDSVFINSDTWKKEQPFFENVDVTPVRCTEIFKVEAEFYRVRHGFFKRDNNSPSFKYMVLSSPKFGEIIVGGYDYDNYSRKFHANQHYNCESIYNS